MNLRFVRKIQNDKNLLVVFRTFDGYGIESVYSFNSQCLCMSTQVGCAMKCVFCASGKNGFVRNLDLDEFFDQYEFICQLGFDIKIIHFAGMGEPLNNIDTVLHFKEAIKCNEWHITTSVPYFGCLRKICGKGFYRIFISLHSIFTETRSKIIPNGISPQDILSEVDGLIKYDNSIKQNLRICYLLLSGVNDKSDEQDSILQYCKNNGYKLVLMAYNSVDDDCYMTQEESVRRFLKKADFFGVDIDDKTKNSARHGCGGCGTLALHKLCDENV